MNTEHNISDRYEISDDFILIQKNAVPEKVAEQWVEYTKSLAGEDGDYMTFLSSFKMDFMQSLGAEGTQPIAGSDRSNMERVRRADDVDFPLSASLGMQYPQMISQICALLQTAFMYYVRRWPYLTTHGEFSVPWLKYHIVKPEGGYHAIHSEWSTDRPDFNRILVWHLALTTHQDQGELEFVYQRKRIQARAGQLVMWPAYFTHAHRGNILREGEKHYITGWFYIDPAGQMRRGPDHEIHPMSAF